MHPQGLPGEIWQAYERFDCNKKTGKISDDISLDRSQMRPSLDKWYRVGDLHLYSVIIMIIKECQVTFS